MLEHRKLIDSIVASANLPGREAEGLCRTTLANYFAAAVLMPYGRFLKEAEGSKYDIDLLCHRFGTSFEQTAHRLTTLQKPDARGIPFFFVRIDVAGNVSKRFSAGRFHFSQFGGACPLWNIHETFQTPGKTVTQIAYAPRLVYAQQYNLERPHPTPIGINCYLCERPHCRQRAHAPLNKTLSFDVRRRGVSLYTFEGE